MRVPPEILPPLVSVVDDYADAREMYVESPDQVVAAMRQLLPSHPSL